MTAMLEESLMRGSIRASCGPTTRSWCRRGRAVRVPASCSGVVFAELALPRRPVKHPAAVGNEMGAGSARRFHDRPLPALIGAGGETRMPGKVYFSGSERVVENNPRERELADR